MFQQRIRVEPRQLGGDRAVGIDHARALGQENQLFGPQGGRGAGRKLFEGEVERFARGRKAQGGEQDDRAALDGEAQRVNVDFAHGAGVPVIDPVDDPGWSRRDEIARNHADLGV